MPTFGYSIANCYHLWSLFPHTAASKKKKKAHVDITAPLSVPPWGVSLLYNHTPIMSTWFCSCVCCCLLFTLKRSYAAGPLCPAGTITPGLKQWLMIILWDCALYLTGQQEAKVQTHSRSRKGSLHSCEIHLWNTHTHTYTLSMLNTGGHPSMMWILCRPVF